MGPTQQRDADILGRVQQVQHRIGICNKSEDVSPMSNQDYRAVTGKAAAVVKRDDSTHPEVPGSGDLRGRFLRSQGRPLTA
jgi:hypothetical protein